MACGVFRRAWIGLLILLLSPAAVRAVAADSCAGATAFRVGAGIHDVTGPPLGVGMMGYAMPHQVTGGIHLRLRSRAFVVVSPCNGERLALVTADVGLVTQAVRQEVLRRLAATYEGLYDDRNVMIGATHTHSGPGGYSHYALYNLTVLGFVPESFHAVVDGIYQSIVKAHENLGPATLRIAHGNLLGASINRSLPAYRLNPEAERARYAHDTDKGMTLLRFDGADGEALGMIAWFPVHATSMGNDNRLISGDNKGYASYAFEQAMGTDYTADRTFVAAFPQSNEGDTSPNVEGGTLGGGTDDFQSTRLSGQKQYRRAQELYDSARSFHGLRAPEAHEDEARQAAQALPRMPRPEEREARTGAASQSNALAGPVDVRFAFVDMDRLEVSGERADGIAHPTCPAAIGFSMLAGAEDGRGVGVEGLTCRSPVPDWARTLCAWTTSDCQGEKPIVVEMGTREPHPWTPDILPLQLARIGPLAIAAVPYEMTTMAGRRLRRTIRETMGAEIDHVVIHGLANAYAGYVTTREEYALQHYEGASTHFGPWTLAAIRQQIAALATALRDGREVDGGPPPRDLADAQVDLQVVWGADTVPPDGSIGGVLADVAREVAAGDRVTVSFWAGNPNRDFRLQDSYVFIERRRGDEWVSVALDGDWQTRLHFQRSACAPGRFCTRVDVEWDVPRSQPAGEYRIRHRGVWSPDGRDVRPYEGESSPFQIRNPGSEIAGRLPP